MEFVANPILNIIIDFLYHQSFVYSLWGIYMKGSKCKIQLL